MALWGGALVVSRGAYEVIPPLALTFFRWCAALIVIFPFVINDISRIKSYIKSWRSIGLVAILIIFGNTMSVIAVNFTTAINASLINGSQPIFTALIALFFIRDEVSIKKTLAIIIALFGVLIMISHGDISFLSFFSMNIGDLIMLLAVLAWAAYTIVLHKSDSLPGNALLLFFISLLGCVLTLPFYLVEYLLFGGFSFSGKAVGSILYLGVIATTVCIFIWNICIKAVGAVNAALFLNLIPIFGVFFAIIILGEYLFLYHIIGSVFIFTGVILGANSLK
tara:strand:+ start:24002 stop:24841 length:840 start_codon:yes stop_codon:yes gene_type:complete